MIKMFVQSLCRREATEGGFPQCEGLPHGAGTLRNQCPYGKRTLRITRVYRGAQA